MQVVALAILALATADQAAAPQQGPATPVERVRTALEQPSSKLTLPEVKPTFRVHIEERRPLQEIFDTPPWQLPHVGWQPPAVPAKTAFGTIPLMNVDLLAVAGAIGDLWRAHARRSAAAEVQRAIDDFCATQINAGAGTLICDNPIR
jgi:hypothetical protein